MCKRYNSVFEKYNEVISGYGKCNRLVNDFLESIIEIKTLLVDAIDDCKDELDAMPKND